jgi:uncharacterized protein (TIGR03083 family)
MNVREMVWAEQDELRELLAGLATDDWDQPTLCGSWKVRDVVAHLISINEAGLSGLLQATVSINWFNSTEVKRRASLTPEELLDAFEKVMGIRGIGRLAPPSAMLVEVLVHSQDIRRPLGLQREIPAERLRVLLPHSVSPASYVPGFGFTGGRRRARGLRLRATDLGWSWGTGHEVSGAAEALLLAVLGRPAALADLSGDGVPMLASRMTNGEDQRRSGS